MILKVQYVNYAYEDDVVMKVALQSLDGPDLWYLWLEKSSSDSLSLTLSIDALNTNLITYGTGQTM